MSVGHFGLLIKPYYGQSLVQIPVSKQDQALLNHEEPLIALILGPWL